jgi:hypothetical protein
MICGPTVFKVASDIMTLSRIFKGVHDKTSKSAESAQGLEIVAKEDKPVVE